MAGLRGLLVAVLALVLALGVLASRKDEEVIPQRTAFGEPLLDAQELADALGMTRRWVYAQVDENGLPAYKLGRSLAFELSAVRGWLAKRRVGNWPDERAGEGEDAPATSHERPLGAIVSALPATSEQGEEDHG
jgi:excisionase family DNA binding protein